MAQSPNSFAKLSIPAFDGVNALSAWNIAKPQELCHAENCRSVAIGTIEKRKGTRRLGDATVATANYGIVYFENSGNPGFYRVSRVSGSTEVMYLSSLAAWTSLTGSGAKLFELGTSTTQFDITNPVGTTFRYTWDGTGTDPDTVRRLSIGTSVVVNAQNFSAGNNGTFTVTDVGTTHFEVTNASGVVESNKTIGTGSIRVSPNKMDFCQAEGNLFMVNGDSRGIYVKSDGTTVIDDSDPTGHLYNCPRGRHIRYYKGSLYTANYRSGNESFPNHCMKSSPLLGIVSLVDGDHEAGATTIRVTDTKYIRQSDTLDVYRGGTLIETLIVTAKTETSITATATNILESADELWVAGTFTGTVSRQFRWADVPAYGTNAKRYDTFQATAGNSNAITMMENIADGLMFGTKNGLSFWNNYSLQPLDFGYGCVSHKGSVKASGMLFFVHYTGIYMTTGGVPQLISSPVEPYIKGATKAGLEATAAGRQGMSVFFSIGDVTLYHDDGSTDKTVTDVVLEYDMRQDNWFVHTGISADEFATYVKTTDADRLQFTSDAGNMHVYEFLNPDADFDDHVTTNTEIPFRADTHWLQISSDEETMSYPQKIVVTADRGNGIKCFVKMNEEESPWYELQGEFRKGVVVVPVTNRDPSMTSPPACWRMKLSLRDYGGKICRISKVKVIYATTLEQAEPSDY